MCDPTDWNAVNTSLRPFAVVLPIVEVICPWLPEDDEGRGYNELQQHDSDAFLRRAAGQKSPPLPSLRRSMDKLHTVAEGAISRTPGIIAATPGVSVDLTFHVHRLPLLNKDACLNFPPFAAWIEGFDALTTARKYNQLDPTVRGKVAVLNLASDWQYRAGGWRTLCKTQIDPEVKGPEQFVFGWVEGVFVNGERSSQTPSDDTLIFWNLSRKTLRFTSLVHDDHLRLATLEISKCLDEDGNPIVPDGKSTPSLISTPTEIESLPLPDNFSHDSHVHSFHPTLSRPIFCHSEGISVWDTRHSKILLNEDDLWANGFSFSSDGRFFVYATEPSQICLWKESPTGYILHWKFNCMIKVSYQLISPSGESIFVFGDRAIQLLRTMDSTTSFSRKPTNGRFIVEFSPDETLAAVTRFEDKTITVLDLKSGDPLSIIDMGMQVCCQRVTGSTVVAVGYEEVVTWNLPARDHVLSTKVNVNDSIRTATISCPRMFSSSGTLRFVSISPGLHTIATVEDSEYTYNRRLLYLRDVPTRLGVGYAPVCQEGHGRPWFISDGREVWYITDHGEANGMTIVRDSESGIIKPEDLGPTDQPPNTPPWLSSRGYRIMDDRWILGFNGKRLLQLPSHWRSSDTNRTWSGRFLALLHSALPEAVILGLSEE
ncbi:hypothetical protein BDM02DRAFT_3188755 [Thelephora ganbajun]|uniref:Uncharacterized protein n=1 Tax=Thelephora ganbajun TaxID=370292 RepID=A0ACB6ZB18_THEGA|nr:hypothetical protein BDM02DRAFT_3188755 [Thelephora ganbajun]